MEHVFVGKIIMKEIMIKYGLHNILCWKGHHLTAEYTHIQVFIDWSVTRSEIYRRAQKYKGQYLPAVHTNIQVSVDRTLTASKYLDGQNNVMSLLSKAITNKMFDFPQKKYLSVITELIINLTKFCLSCKK